VTASKGQKAYDLRCRFRWTWTSIANELGYSNGHSALRGARVYAQRSDLPWPVQARTKGAVIYSARKNGLSWLSIANNYNQSIAAAQRCAYKWATRNGKTWPPK
jgi:hypothetical protein